MAKLNQVIAIEKKGVKARSVASISEVYKTVQKPALFNGFAKNYEKKDTDGEDLPAERQRVQFTTGDVLRRASTALDELMQVTARKDWSNCVAKADVKVGDVTLLQAVPVTYLIFLEKSLTDFRTFVGAAGGIRPEETKALSEQFAHYVNNHDVIADRT